MASQRAGGEPDFFSILLSILLFLVRLVKAGISRNAAAVPARE